MDLLREHLPDLPGDRLELLARYAELLREWNGRINLISRKDVENLTEHHLLHSLLLARWVRFPARARVLDVGTGGGLPGLPLAILFPQTRFFLLDSIAKKVRAVGDMIARLELPNAEAVLKRAEVLESRFDYLLARAVAPLPELLPVVAKNLARQPSWSSRGTALPAGTPANGLFYWKGDLYRAELDALGVRGETVYDLGQATGRPYFAAKYIVHLPASPSCSRFVR